MACLHRYWRNIRDLSWRLRCSSLVNVRSQYAHCFCIPRERIPRFDMTNPTRVSFWTLLGEVVRLGRWSITELPAAIQRCGSPIQAQCLWQTVSGFHTRHSYSRCRTRSVGYLFCYCQCIHRNNGGGVVLNANCNTARSTEELQCAAFKSRIRRAYS